MEFGLTRRKPEKDRTGEKMFDKVSLYHGERNGEMVPMITFWNQTGDVATDVETVTLTDEQYKYLVNKKS